MRSSILFLSTVLILACGSGSPDPGSETTASEDSETPSEKYDPKDPTLWVGLQEEETWAIPTGIELT